MTTEQTVFNEIVCNFKKVCFISIINDFKKNHFIAVEIKTVKI
jgi:hypothetical protein